MRESYRKVFRAAEDILRARDRGEAAYEMKEDRRGVSMLVKASSDALKRMGFPIMSRESECVIEFRGTHPDETSGDISVKLDDGLPMLIRFVSCDMLEDRIRDEGASAVAADLLGSLGG